MTPDARASSLPSSAVSLPRAGYRGGTADASPSSAQSIAYDWERPWPCVKQYSHILRNISRASFAIRLVTTDVCVDSLDEPSSSDPVIAPFSLHGVLGASDFPTLLIDHTPYLCE